MSINDRAADIRRSDSAGSKNKLSVIDDDTCVIFGIDLRQGGMKVSAGVEVGRIADLTEIRDMLDRVIARHVRPQTRLRETRDDWGT